MGESIEHGKPNAPEDRGTSAKNKNDGPRRQALKAVISSNTVLLIFLTGLLAALAGPFLLRHHYPFNNILSPAAPLYQYTLRGYSAVPCTENNFLVEIRSEDAPGCTALRLGNAPINVVDYYQPNADAVLCLYTDAFCRNLQYQFSGNVPCKGLQAPVTNFRMVALNQKC